MLFRSVRIDAGTLFWFNNKYPHSAKNVGDCNRITFVFDVQNPDLVALQKQMVYN